MTTIEVNGVGRTFGRTTAVADVHLAVGSRHRIGVVGESGSGKSTLGRMLVGLETPTSGEIVVDGTPLRTLLSTRSGVLSYRRMVQLVAQDTSSSFDPRHRVRTAITTPARLILGLSAADAADAVLAIVDELGIDRALLDRYPTQLSGGQRQRMSIARALVSRPRVIVADEAVSALDVSVQGGVLNALKAYCERHDAGLVFISHGLPATAFITEELVVMHDARIVEAGPTAELLSRPRDEYTRMLLAAYAGDGAAA